MLKSPWCVRARLALVSVSLALLAGSIGGCGNSGSPGDGGSSGAATFHGVIPDTLLGDATAMASGCVYTISLASGCIEIDADDLGFADMGLVGTTSSVMNIGVALKTASPYPGVTCTFQPYSATRNNNNVGGTYAALTAGGGDAFNAWGFTGARAGSALDGTMTLNVTTYDLDGAGSYVTFPAVVLSNYLMQSGGCDGGIAGGSGGSGGGSAGGSGGGSGGSGDAGVLGPPTIGYVTPDGVPGEVISISGTNFPSSTSAITVTIGGATAAISSLTSGNVNVVVPSLNAGTYTIIVTTSGGDATSPYTIDAAHQPANLVIDTSNVYWLELDGSVKKVSLDGGTVTTLATGLMAVGDLTQDLSALYFTEVSTGKLEKVSKSGGPVTTVLAGLDSPYALASDLTNLYFIENGSSRLSKVAKTGGAATLLTSGSIDSDVLLVDGTGVYYYAPGGAIYKEGLDGGTPFQLEPVADQGAVPALDSTSVYWGRSALHRVGTDGGSFTTYAASVSAAAGLAVDSSSLYYVNLSTDGSLPTGEIRSVPLQDGTVTTLVGSSGAGGWLAVDSNSVYWTESNNAAVKKVAKDGGTVITLATSPNVP